MDDEEDDIFHLLLKENKIKTKNFCQTELSKTGRIPSKVDMDSDEKDDALPFDLKFSIDSSSCSLTKTKSESLVLEHVYEQTLLVLDHCSDENFVYVLVDNNGMAAVQIYRLDRENTHKPKIAAYLETSMKSSLFKDKDRAESRHLYIINQLSSHDAMNAAYNGLSIQSGNVYLPKATYASLFGKTTGLVKSSVVLLCANDGCVFWRPVKSAEQDGKFYLMCQLHDLVNSVLLVSVDKKSNVDEEVSSTLHSALMMTDGEADKGFGLLVANCIGECCLLLPTPQLTSGCEHFPVRFCLPHPIVCCIHRGKQFIYSTGWSVESVTLCLKQDENQMSITLENCTTLKMANIGRLFIKTTELESGPQLMGLTSDLDTICIPTSTSSNATFSAPETHLLPNTIQRIQQHASSIQRFQNVSVALDSHLIQLNLFANLCQQNQKQNFGTDKKLSPLIHCDCFLDRSQGYSNNSEIRIQLRNDSLIHLSNQWSLLMTVIEDSYFLEDKTFSDSFCFKMEMGFHSGCLKTFSVPLPEHLCADPPSKLRIRVSLILCVSQDVINQSSVILFPTCNLDKVLEVEIHNQVLDYLHVSHVSANDTALSSRRDTSHSTEELKAALERLRGNKMQRS